MNCFNHTLLACRGKALARALLACLTAWPATIALSASLAVAQDDISPEIFLKEDPPHAFTLKHPSLIDLQLKTKPSELFFVAAEPIGTLEKPTDAQPMMGSYAFGEDSITFTPRFPLSQRVQYRLHLAAELRQIGKAQDWVFRLPEPTSAAPRVVAVYPSVDTLPENVLKFYIHFSRPMNRGQAYRHVRLEKDGTRIDQAFLELGEELWDQRQQRFTLFVHPGRIKRGLAFREEEGPAIEAGAEYNLIVSEEWEAPNGQRLEQSFRKTFQVTSADRTQPSPERWAIETPDKDTQTPLHLRFDEPLDYALLNRVIQVRDPQNSIVAGDVSIDQHETRWSFHPSQIWQAGVYRIEVATLLEDAAGNSIAKPFERSFERATNSSPDRKIAIEFRVE